MGDLCLKRWTPRPTPPAPDSSPAPRTGCAGSIRDPACARAANNAAVPLAEVARLSGQSSRAIVDLVRSGALHQVPGRRPCEVKVASAERWLFAGLSTAAALNP